MSAEPMSVSSWTRAASAASRIFLVQLASVPAVLISSHRIGWFVAGESTIPAGSTSIACTMRASRF